MSLNYQISTPAEYVRKLLDAAGYKTMLYGKRILENSCGDGNVLCEIVKRYIKDAISNSYSNNEIVLGLDSGKAININAVSPSMIETKFLKNIDERFVQMVAENSPEKRNAKPKDVVPTIQFLLSDAANYMHGQNVVVNNGGA